MAPRDPAKTARNKRIEDLKSQLRALLPKVLAETGFANEASLNATIGGKAAHFIDLHTEVILSPDQYVTLYMKGFRAEMSPPGKFQNSHRTNYEKIKKSKSAQLYFMTFLKRAYLKHFDELSRKRPELHESEVWIGQTNAEYGLFITPRWNTFKQEWENDRSEIRHFPQLYWTIGHILESGLVTPGDPDPIKFSSVDNYLTFFKNILVRASGSIYERGIAKLYVDYVRSAPKPSDVPLLIPEFRYDGKLKKHKYRLDFTIIDPFTMRKIAFELSPWSSHGYLSNTKKLTPAEINAMALDNFAGEMTRHKDWFKKRDVFALIYTDAELANLSEIFEDMKQYLEPVDTVVQLDFHLMDKFFA